MEGIDDKKINIDFEKGIISLVIDNHAVFEGKIDKNIMDKQHFKDLELQCELLSDGKDGGELRVNGTLPDIASSVERLMNKYDIGHIERIGHLYVYEIGDDKGKLMVNKIYAHPSVLSSHGGTINIDISFKYQRKMIIDLKPVEIHSWKKLSWLEKLIMKIKSILGI